MFSNLPFWAYIIITLVFTHITIVSVTIFLHRHQAHRALDLHPVVSHFFRFWLWLTTGMSTRGWVAVHRKHHARVETEEDPHSPQVLGIKKVLAEGAELYRIEATNEETLRNFGHGTPDDWIERNVYRRFNHTGGIAAMFIINVLLFGFIGITIWAIQMMWIPFFAAGVINGIGHWWGYRNYESPDASTNIIPIGALIGGEELHNNHHAFASSARFSSKWYEFDLGWSYIKLLRWFKLARVKKLAPKPLYDYGKQGIDLDTLKAVVTNRFHVMSQYTRDVVYKVYKEEKAKADRARRRILRGSKRLLTRNEVLLDHKARKRLEATLSESHTLEVVYEFNRRLQALWLQKTASQENLLNFDSEGMKHCCNH